MDKSERMDLRRRRLERLGRWNNTPSPPPVQPAMKTAAIPTATTSTATKRCGCSRSKG